MLAQAMSRLLADRKWSLRQCSIATAIPYSTLDRIKKGQNVEAEIIAKLAYKISSPDSRFETVMQWLKLAGKDDMVSVLNAISATARMIPEGAKQRVHLPSGGEVLILPSGREFKATPENLALLETLLLALEQTKQNTQ